MAVKLAKCTYPSGVTASDLKCYGPPATKDTEFDAARLADMGCFQQEDIDSNKYYHACMCTDPKGHWYVYVEYGRVGASKPQFQFYDCGSEAEAQRAFADQCAEKNTKRGQWTTVGGLQLFRPKPGKDLYLVQKLNARSFGLPDAKNITAQVSAPAPKKSTKVVTKKTSRDPQTLTLWRDLVGGAVSYARSTIQGGTVPSIEAINESRDMLQAARKRLVVVGDVLQDQISDHDLKQLTYALYSRIPKIKPLNAAESTWILSKDNIFAWEQDIAAFETALQSGQAVVETEDDPLAGLPLDMEWIEPKSDLGQWLMRWWPAATKGRHGYGKMAIKNLWKVQRHGDEDRLRVCMDSVLSEMGKSWNNERPLHQDKKRPDLSTELRKLYWDANVSLTLHGTRSVNCPGILREGFRFPKELVGVVISGAMFGPGLYMADDWMKSAGYTSLRDSYYSGGGGAVKGRDAFMFACDVVMGHPYVASGPHGYTQPPTGHHSIFGKAGHSGVQNNEWIIFRKIQCNIRYLAEFTTSR